MIDIFFFDIEGTFTPAFFLQNEAGRIYQFCVHDGIGLELLAEKGIKIIAISGTSNKTIRERMQDLQNSKFGKNYKILLNVANKQEYIKDFKTRYYKIAYIGDDMNDLEAMKLCDYVACPTDAAKKVKEYVSNNINGYVCDRTGGFGAVREFIDILLEKIENAKKV